MSKANSPLIDRVYEFDQIIDAFRYVSKGHKKGNVVVAVLLKDKITCH